MACKITYLNDGGVHIDYEGDVTYPETQKVDAEVYTSSTHPISKVPYIIADFSKVKKLDFPYNDLRQSAAADQNILETNPNLLIAVVGNVDLIFGMARVWHSFLGASEDRTWIFRSYEDADIWIKAKLAKK